MGCQKTMRKLDSGYIPKYGAMKGLEEAAGKMYDLQQRKDEMKAEIGAKYDKGKNRLGLVFGGFSNSLQEVGEVGTFGANKYTDNGWKEVPNGIDRYTDAALRHLFQHLSGERFDSESNLSHLTHAIWNLLAVSELSDMESKDADSNNTEAEG